MRPKRWLPQWDKVHPKKRISHFSDLVARDRTTKLKEREREADRKRSLSRPGERKKEISAAGGLK